MNNYYEILWVADNAPDEVIKAAYKAMTKKYHPDVYEGDSSVVQQKMTEINEAFETFSDSKKRKEYDSLLKSSGSDNVDENTNCTTPVAAEDVQTKNPEKMSKSEMILGCLIWVVTIFCVIKFCPSCNGGSSDKEESSILHEPNSISANTNSPEYPITNYISFTQVAKFDQCENLVSKDLIEAVKNQVSSVKCRKINASK